MVKTHVFRVKNNNDAIEKLQWLNESFGPGPELINGHLAKKYRWSFQNAGNGIYILYFVNEYDYTFYLLKWGQ